MTPISVGWPLAVTVAALTAATVLVTRAGDVGSWRAPVTAVLRATVQLAAVALVLAVVLQSLPLTVAFLVVMTVVAALTSYRRISSGPLIGSLWLVLPLLAGLAPVLGAALALGVVPPTPIAVLPIGGIVIGGTMTATSLAGARVVERIETERGQLEAALSLGLTRPQGVRLLGRPTAALALVPGLDQTRTVGLVTLPGAFVGVLLGGGSAIDAGAAQLLVLVGLLYAQAAATTVTVELVANDRLGPGRPSS